MKQGGPERGGGEGQSFVARERSYDEMKADYRQDAMDQELVRAERVQNRDFDQTKVDQYLTNFRNLGKNNSIDQVDKILGNTDVAGKPEMLAAYKLWEHEQAQGAVAAAYENTDENVVDMDSYRQKKDDEESVA